MFVGLLIAGVILVLGLTWLPAIRAMVVEFAPASGELIDVIIPLMPLVGLILIILAMVHAVRGGGV